MEDILIERGIDICQKPVRRGWNRFGTMLAGEVGRKRGEPDPRYTAAALALRPDIREPKAGVAAINGEMVYLWRAVDYKGEMLDYVTCARDKGAAPGFMKKALKRHGPPERIFLLSSHGAAMNERGTATSGQLVAVEQKPGKKLSPNGPTTKANDGQIKLDQPATEVHCETPTMTVIVA